VKSLVFQAVAFAGLTVWAALSNAWVVPAFACLAASRVVMLAVVNERVSPANVGSALLAQFALLCVGCIYLLTAFVGLPDTTRFWAVFDAVSAIFLPILAVGRRSLFR
jgi:hypothetical protein